MFRGEDPTLPFGANRASVAFIVAMVVIAVALLMVSASIDMPMPTGSHDSLAFAKPAPSRSTPIVFVRRDEGGWEKWMKHLYLMAPDGSGQRRIAREVPGWDAAWAPDGTQIVFDSTCALADSELRILKEAPQVYVMQADGSAVKRLTGDVPEFSSQHSSGLPLGTY